MRIRATGSVNYGRSIPSIPRSGAAGTTLPDNRDLRDAWPEGVTLPRAIDYNLGCTTLGLPAVVSDLARSTSGPPCCSTATRPVP